jgi:hypothetical protein
VAERSHILNDEVEFGTAREKAFYFYSALVKASKDQKLVITQQSPSTFGAIRCDYRR